MNPHELVSVVVPVYNEEAVLEALFARLYRALDQLDVPYEVILVDDGSRDRSAELITAQYHARPDRTRAVFLAGNAGQHLAIVAGFEQARGGTVVTIDADLQNPPEEIANLLAEAHKGHDYVGSVRRDRHDSWWRARASRILNWLRERSTRVRVSDQGCMLRAYDRRIVRAIVQSAEAHTFIPALGYLLARNPTEIPVAHARRAAGKSKYSLLKLIQLNFDLMTGFSVTPLRLFSLCGMALAVLAGLFVCYLFVRRLLLGPEAEGVFTLFAINFFLIGIVLFGIGLLGEYVGRIYEQVRARPRFIVKSVLEPQAPASARPAPLEARR